MYRAAVMNAIDDLVKDRFMLCQDTETVYARLLQAGLAAGVPAYNALRRVERGINAVPETCRSRVAGLLGDTTATRSG
jgi:hypothetical protein